MGWFLYEKDICHEKVNAWTDMHNVAPYFLRISWRPIKCKLLAFPVFNHSSEHEKNDLIKWKHGRVAFFRVHQELFELRWKCLVLKHSLYFRDKNDSWAWSFEAFDRFLNIISIWADNHSVYISKGISHSLKQKRSKVLKHNLILCYYTLYKSH